MLTSGARAARAGSPSAPFDSVARSPRERDLRRVAERRQHGAVERGLAGPQRRERLDHQGVVRRLEPAPGWWRALRSAWPCRALEPRQIRRRRAVEGHALREDVGAPAESAQTLGAAGESDRCAAPGARSSASVGPCCTSSASVRPSRCSDARGIHAVLDRRCHDEHARDLARVHVGGDRGRELLVVHQASVEPGAARSAEHTRKSSRRRSVGVAPARRVIRRDRCASAARGPASPRARWRRASAPIAPARDRRPGGNAVEVLLHERERRARA